MDLLSQSLCDLLLYYTFIPIYVFTGAQFDGQEPQSRVPRRIGIESAR